jgi:hypothetical protein
MLDRGSIKVDTDHFPPALPSEPVRRTSASAADIQDALNILRAAKYSDLRPAKVGLKRGFEHPELKPEDDRPETD